MKHPVCDILQEERRRLELGLPEDRWEALCAAVAWLGPVAHQMGLTNYLDVREFASNLVAPTFPLLRAPFQDRLFSPALDFGAGSGAVGLTLAILRPDLEVVLADRRARVIQFLDLAAHRLHLANCRMLSADLAAPPTEWLQACGTVLIRAFGPTPVALKHAAQLVRPGGSIALWHQPPPPPAPAKLRPGLTLMTSVPALALTIYDRPS